MPTGAAIIGASAIGAGGSIASGLIGSSASKSASQAQTSALQQALALQQQYFNTAQGYLSPFITAGQSVLPTLQALLTPGTNMTDTLSQIPGFQFTQDWGQKAVQNIGTTTGLGGNTLAAGAKYATGVAQQGFGQIVNALQQYANTGAGAAGSLAGAATGFGNMTGNTLGGIGTSKASGILGSANALSGAITGGTSSVGNALLLSKLLGGGSGSGIYSSIGSMPATGAGSPDDLTSALYAMSQGINPFG